METLSLSLRLTNRYVGGYDHLDDWRDLPGSARLTPTRCVDEGNGHDDGGVYLRWARLPARLSKHERDDAVRALESSLSRYGCSHDWDCCGCPSYQTRAIRRQGRRVLLRTRTSYNY